jgi:hypothetical protein
MELFVLFIISRLLSKAKALFNPYAIMKFLAFIHLTK